MNRIRNFVIIAHIDHGKSTLADRLLEITHTVETRRMHSQYLDQMELEQERGITIKMAPVRMQYTYDNSKYTLNLIDTPGHSDFSYEVSRALEAVEGAILLVDATQGIQAQTLANFRSARSADLKIIGAINKIDLRPHDLDEVVLEMADLLNCDPSEIRKVSGKTGEGVELLLQDVIDKIQPPKKPRKLWHIPRALIFDSLYDDHKGVIAAVRVFEGTFNSPEISLVATGAHSKIKEYGYFMPHQTKTPVLEEGEIGYIATGIKNPHEIRIGDTVISSVKGAVVAKEEYALEGYRIPKSVVFVSLYPEDGDDFEKLEKALERLKLNDSAITTEPDQNEILGRGFKVGFLGRLHFEITAERLKREYDVPVITTFPSVLYKIKTKDAWKTIIKPEDVPGDYEEIWEPMVKIEIIIPSRFLSSVIALQSVFRMRNIETHSLFEGLGTISRIRLSASMPLAELITDFDDQIKSVTEGYASFSYELEDYEKADIVKVDILVTHKLLPGLSRFLPAETYEREARKMIERLKELLEKEQWVQPIQAQANGRIIARETIPALRKDVTGYLYGGDRTRKMKLWKKQQKGKKRLLERGVQKTIEPRVFKELLKK